MVATVHPLRADTSPATQTEVAGRCGTVEAEVMFPDEDLPNDHPDVVAAKQVCQGCVLRESCLSDALRRRDPFGVWGGMTGKEREALRRKGVRRAVAARQAAQAAAVEPEVISDGPDQGVLFGVAL